MKNDGSTILEFTKAEIVTILFSQFVISPLLGLAVGSLESAGLTIFASSLVLLLAVQDIQDIELPIFR